MNLAGFEELLKVIKLEKTRMNPKAKGSILIKYGDVNRCIQNMHKYGR